MEKYNGWKNKASWNVALWLNNDETLHFYTRVALKNYNTVHDSINVFIKFVTDAGITHTEDGYELNYENLVEYFCNEFDEMKEEIYKSRLEREGA